jgi:nicotinamide mononucleotide adenylyltransferase|tara:strand:- start:329 stop:925 length:597 start_codon:yes stop_codon:yes gene_type:complete
MTIAVYLAHLNPVTNAHAEIIKDLTKDDEVVVMPVRFLVKNDEINSKSFPFTFEVRKEMLESVFGESIKISPNYTFHAPFKKYFPPLVSRGSWKLRKEILSEIEGDYYTYTGDKAEGLMLKLYRLKPKVGQRKELSATSVKNDMYNSVLNKKSDWEKKVPDSVAEIIRKNWNVVEGFSSSEDNTMRVLGMKFPREGYT